MLTAVSAIFLLGLLVFVHELGHFLAFKIIGVKVLKFSLGFPPVMYKRQIGETVYQIGWIPLGGYVKPLGEEDMEGVLPEDKGRALMDQPPLKRIFSFVAGPMMNLLFPVLIYWVVFAFPGEELSSRVGMTMPGMPAQSAGILAGDRIVAIEGRAMRFFTDIQDAIYSKPGKELKVRIERDGRAIETTLRPEATADTTPLGDKATQGRIGILPYSVEARVFVLPGKGPAADAGIQSWDVVKSVNGRKIKDWADFRAIFEGAGAGRVEVRVERPIILPSAAKVTDRKEGKKDSGVELAFAFDSPGTLSGAGLDSAALYVSRVDPGSPAAAAGLEPGDRAVSLDGRPLVFWGSMEEVFRRTPEKEFVLEFIRGGVQKTAKLKLEKKTQINEFKHEEVRWTSGAYNECGLTGGDFINHGFQPVRAMGLSLKETMSFIVMTYQAFYRIVTGTIPLDKMGGPIMIFDMAGTVAKKGIMPYLWLMALISINLGIFNLLPMPVLDGGHVLISLVEMALRRPISMRARIISNYIGLAFLGCVFVLVFKNDIQRYFGESIAGFFR